MLKMKKLIICVLAIIMLTPVQGQDKQQVEALMDSYEEEKEPLECFRCDLGFWDACYTTKINCSLNERCFTGRGKAVDVLDVKTMGCAMVDECDVETMVEFFPNNTVFVMTKNCCDTSFCNSAQTLSLCALWNLMVALLTTWHIIGTSKGSQ